MSHPVPYTVYQRGANGKRDIALSGTYSAFGKSPTSIEGRLAGGAWQTVDAAPANGSWSGTLSQVSGQGALELRMTGFGTSVGVNASKPIIGVGDVFLIMGQSNAVGRGDTNNTYSHATLKCGMFRKDYTWVELADPIDDRVGANVTDEVLDNFTQIGGNGGRGTVWTKLATSIMADQSVPVAFVPCARDATQIAVWAPGADSFDRTTKFGASMYRAQQAGGVKAILWWLGESDAGLHTTKAAFKTALTNIANAAYTAIGAPLIPCTLLNCTGNDGDAGDSAWLPNIQDAIRESWGTGHILAGPDISDLSPSDTVHAMGDALVATIAGRWWTSVKAALYA